MTGRLVLRRNHGRITTLRQTTFNQGKKMITYMYWTAIVALAVILFAICAKMENWKTGATLAAIILIAGWSLYYFRLEQVFVKRYGGVMTIHAQDGDIHLGATWKDDNLWVESYDPETKICTFREYSKGNLLQGKVTIKNCTPLLAR
jgi:hypothetical protein